MSNKPRTKEQKLRRKYLEDCKKDGINPMPIEDWKNKWKKINGDWTWKEKSENKTSKPSCKSVKPAKKVCDKKPAKPIAKNGRKVIVERSDVVTFKDCKPHEIMRLAMFMLIDAYKGICASNS